MDLHFVLQAWHLATWAFTLCGRRGTYGTGLGLVRRLVAADAASFCVAGVALGDMDLRFVRGTYGTGLGLVTRLVAADAASFCVAGVALDDMDLHFVWQAWHLATWAFTLCGRRGTYVPGPRLVTRLVAAHAALFCVAGVALGDMDLTLCGRRGTWRHQPSLCVAGVALTALGWGLVTRLVAAGAASFCVASVALGDVDLRFVWQAWRLVT
eukprot:s652_g14.t1